MQTVHLSRDVASSQRFAKNDGLNGVLFVRGGCLLVAKFFTVIITHPWCTVV